VCQILLELVKFRRRYYQNNCGVFFCGTQCMLIVAGVEYFCVLAFFCGFVFYVLMFYALWFIISLFNTAAIYK